MFRTLPTTAPIAPFAASTCIVRPGDPRARSRSDIGSFRLDHRDSAMPARFHIA